MSSSLLHRVASGDSGAVRECIDFYGSLVWSLARRMSPSTAEAEDAVQDIFLDLWRSAERFDPGVSSETTFVAMIARRRLLDRRRHHRRRPETQSLADTPTPAEDASMARLEACAEARLAAGALARLRPEQRLVLLLSACHGLSHEEIASTVNMPLGTVKAHARRGLLRVREMLEGGAGAAAEGPS